MSPGKTFQHCPQCGERTPGSVSKLSYECPACGFLYFFNPAVSVAALAFNASGEALFIRRAKDPGKGRLAMPGGFVDAGETAEAALQREFLEEVNLRIDSLTYLCSQTNEYHYRDITYPVLDLFYVARAVHPAEARALEDVASFGWLPIASVEPEEIAFPSMRRALEIYGSSDTSVKPGLRAPALSALRR